MEALYRDISDEHAAIDDEPEATHARVLIVDDSPAIREMIRHVLAKSHLEANIVEATNGVDALRQVLTGHFDCVVCDILMPELDGMSFLKQLRARQNRLEMPVIFLTVRETLRDKVAGFRAGASDFLVKPVEPDELIARVDTQVRLSRAHQRARALTDRLKVLVETDPLTGVGNRRQFMKRLSAEYGRAERNGHRFAVLIADLDHFKRVNDTRGHQVGDVVLTQVAKTLVDCARRYDSVCRLGGEEFAILLPECEREGAMTVAERVRSSLEAAVVPDGMDLVTVSIGVATGPFGDGDHAEAVLKRADDRLYEAKNAGRNRVVGPPIG
jgi:two-component system cell cycle response regulator